MNPILKKSLEYVLFWTASVALLAWHFALGSQVERIDVWYSILFHIGIGFSVGINTFVLIPVLLAAGKRLKYGASVLVILVSGVWVHELTFTYVSSWLFPGYFFVSYLLFPEIAAYLIAYLLGTTLIQFSRSWFREADLRSEVLELRQLQQEQELHLLQQQVQPHFLFNSLNSIYALVRSQNEYAGQAVLTLSDLLRYTIKHAGSFSVPLDEEIEYIRNYVDLQRFRYDNTAQITVSLPQNDYEEAENWHIVPLILINLVENAFKHGVPGKQGFQVNIQLNCKQDELTFLVENTADGEGRNHSHAGTGLRNMRRRLEVFYPGRHHLDISIKPDLYRVSLTLRARKPKEIGGGL